ncbi:MAG: hypothetical protein PVI54_19570 [Desulfobacteraceae bacterium]|jgi:hypothetical protein
MAWPEINQPYSVKKEYIKKAHRTNAETGRPMSMVAVSSALFAWDLKYILPQDQLDLVLDAFNTDQGESFSWTDPSTNTTYDVQYDMDKVSHEYLSNQVYDVSIKLAQV